jgi:hypothetical protein
MQTSGDDHRCEKARDTQHADDRGNVTTKHQTRIRREQRAADTQEYDDNYRFSKNG